MTSRLSERMESVVLVAPLWVTGWDKVVLRVGGYLY